MLKGWGALAKFAITLQPLAVAGLMIERTPSLTRAATEGELGASLVGVALLLCSLVCLATLVVRYVFRWTDRPPEWMPVLLIIMASLMGGVTVMVASGPHTNLVLSLLYFAETVALLMASHLTEREIEASHVR